METFDSFDNSASCLPCQLQGMEVAKVLVWRYVLVDEIWSSHAVHLAQCKNQTIDCDFVEVVGEWICAPAQLETCPSVEHMQGIWM